MRNMRTIATITLFLLIFFQLNAQLKEVKYWRTVFYNDNVFQYITSEQAESAADWRNTEFDDSNWNTGRGGIGYGDNDDNTIINAVSSVFMRTKFTIPDTSEIGAALLNVSYDDAFVAYLNGVEIARSDGLTDAFPEYNILSTVSHDAAMLATGVPEAFLVDKQILKHNLIKGTNVLAVQVHNVGHTSTDMSSNIWFSVGLKSVNSTYYPLPDWFSPPISDVFSSNLPIMVIETNNQNIPDEPKITAHMGLINNGEGKRNFSDDPLNEYNGLIGIELRGNSTQNFPKKPYNFETRDSIGMNRNVSLLGLPAENDWVLRASYLDHTFIRNGLANYMSRETGRWASRTKHVEVILNGEYIGIYLLMEKLKRDDNRLDIATLDSSDINGEELTGGYIWEITGFDDHFGESRKIKYPNINDIQPEQLVYIKNIDDAFRNKMRSANSIYSDPNTGYVEHINVESFLYEAIVQEAMRNSDAYGWSGYYHKDKNDLIHAGPVWDFDQSSGNSSYPDNGIVEGWLIDHPHTDNTPFYWPLLLNDPFFKYSLKLRWEEMRADKFANEKLMAYIDSIANSLSEAQSREFTKWPVLGTYFWRETNGYENRNTYQKEIDYLKSFLTARWSWIDNQLYSIPKPDTYPEITTPGAFADTFIFINAKKFYFNLDEIFAYPYISGLKYTASVSDTAIVKVTIKSSDTLKLKIKELGYSDVHITAKDTYGNKKNLSFNVEVRYPDYINYASNSTYRNKIMIYPNPANDLVTFGLAGEKTANGMLEIFNLAGQLVDNNIFNQKNHLHYNVHQLENGIYLVKLMTEDGRIYLGKLVVNK